MAGEFWLTQQLSSRSKDNKWGIRVANLGEVVPGKIYRSAVPKGADELRSLREKLGIRTIMDLRQLRTDNYEFYNRKRLVESEGLFWAGCDLSDKEAPKDFDIRFFESILAVDGRYPILIHCEGGRHRTGGFVAYYRVKHQGWTAEQAYAEALQYGFYPGLGHGAWKEWILAL